MKISERRLEDELIEKLHDLKYEFRNDIRDRAALEKNFREKFQTLNRVTPTDAEFRRLLDEIVTPDVFAAHTLRTLHSSTSTTGARTRSRLSVSFVSIPIIAIIATMSCCSSTGCLPSRSS